jgi:3-hydroxyacyl-CoA dehydrogenase
LLPLINEAAKILQEGIALRPGDIDVVWTAGYGFPNHRGGPLWMADEIKLRHVVERLQYFAKSRGNRFGYWTPAPLLVELAAGGERISDWRARGVQDAR